MRHAGSIPALVITADDYGYRPAYDRGILEAARLRAVDAVSAMVSRARCEPEPLLEAGVEVGLHLDLDDPAAGEGERAGPQQREIARRELLAQLDRFEELFGRAPAFLDGHRHSHAAPGIASMVARAASELGLPVRSVNERHQRLLRCLGVPTQDRLVGRLGPSEPALPALIEGVLEATTAPPPGVTEWMVHPGYRDPDRASSYDAEREEDLELVLGLRGPLERSFRRATHSALSRD